MRCPNGLQIGYDYNTNSMCNHPECDVESQRHCRRYRKTCIGKADFGSKVIADRIAIELAKENTKLTYHSYECSFCGGWHVGRIWF